MCEYMLHKHQKFNMYAIVLKTEPVWQASRGKGDRVKHASTEKKQSCMLVFHLWALHACSFSALTRPPPPPRWKFLKITTLKGTRISFCVCDSETTNFHVKKFRNKSFLWFNMVKTFFIFTDR